MKSISIFTVLLLMGVSLAAQKTINDPNAEVRQVSGFHSIRISNSFDVYITQGNTEALAISASKQEFRDKIITKVENGVLIIRFDDDKKFWKNFNGDKTKLRAYISVKDLERLIVGGACDVFMEDGIRGETLTINLSGASDLKGKVEVNRLNVNVSGASDMEIRGTAKDVNVDVSGASDFTSYDLTSDMCTAEASGASSVAITVNKEINASASGASSIRFKGAGLIRNIRTSGASNVSRRS